MTKAQIKKLEAIIAKLETLQKELSDTRTHDMLSKSKSVLLDTLRKAN